MAANETITLRFGRDDSGPVSVDHLAEVLAALQRGLYKVARYIQEGNEAVTRTGPVPSAIRDVVALAITRVHSSELVVEVAPAPPQQFEMEIGSIRQKRESTFELFGLALRAPSDDASWEEFETRVQSASTRRSLLSVVTDLAPADPRATLYIDVPGYDTARLTSASARMAKERIGGRATAEGWAIGYLSEARAMLNQTCKVRVDTREVLCSYPPELLEHVRQNLGELVVIAGQATYDEEGTLTELVADEVVPVDLSPVVVAEFEVGVQTVRLREPLRLTPRVDDNLLVLDAPDMGLYVYGVSRDELVEALNRELNLLWRLYVLADDSILEPQAARLKRTLIERMVA
jgi:hypothetical protein